MSLFSRKNRDDASNEMAESYERAKRDGSALRQINHAHNRLDKDRVQQAEKICKGSSTSGPSSSSASTPKRGRGW